LPSGSEWLHEIKHDGFRVIAGKKGAQVRALQPSRQRSHYRFPLIVETLTRLRSRSCIIDGEAVPVMTTASLCSIAFATATMTKAFSFKPST
jgi:ATP-dependent DNA ligase